MTDKPIVSPEQILYILINQMMDKYESHPLTRAMFEMAYVKEGYELDWDKRLDENGEWKNRELQN